MLCKPTSSRSVKIVFLVGILFVLVITFFLVFLFMAYRLDLARLSNPGSDVNIRIAHPYSTHLCIAGCQADQNWIEFYLPTNSYYTGSLQLKTSIFMAKILTIGISSTKCRQLETPGFTCVEMELSHRLLQALTGLNVIPLSKLQNTNNWWLEFRPK
jgi:hypothetical protein